MGFCQSCQVLGVYRVKVLECVRSLALTMPMPMQMPMPMPMSHVNITCIVRSRDVAMRAPVHKRSPALSCSTPLLHVHAAIKRWPGDQILPSVIGAMLYVQCNASMFLFCFALSLKRGM